MKDRHCTIPFIVFLSTKVDDEWVAFNFARWKGSRSTIVLWIYLTLVSCSLKMAKSGMEGDGSVVKSTCFGSMRIWVPHHPHKKSNMAMHACDLSTVWDRGRSISRFSGLTLGLVSNLSQRVMWRIRAGYLTYFDLCTLMSLCTCVYTCIYTVRITPTHS